MNNKAQEEMVGFALIVVLVSVILVILLAVVMYSSKDKVELNSYEVTSFIASLLVYTTDCSNSVQMNLPVQKLITECIENKRCVDGRNSCLVLNETLSGIIKATWEKGNRPVTGYNFKISSQDFETMEFIGGNVTSKNSRMSTQEINLRNREVLVSLEIYG